MSSARPSEDGNPYVRLLAGAVAEYAEVFYFSWARALFGRYDVIHLHWPETLLRGKTRLRATAKCFLASLLLARLRLSGKAVVRTVHNATPHEPATAVEEVLLRGFDSTVDEYIVMTDSSPVGPTSSVTMIPHGHYRDSYPAVAPMTDDRDLVLFFGSLRPYKGVEELIAAYGALEERVSPLEVAGQPQNAQYGAALEALAAKTEGVTLRLYALTPRELASTIERARLVVLPFKDLLNSGSALLALSLGRPILLPSSSSALSLRDEVGSAWVQTYRPPLTASVLDAALREAGSNARKGLGFPNLQHRNWSGIGKRHVDVYRAAAGRD